MLKAAGIMQHVTPHGLRDTYASHLLSAGVQLAYVSAQLGHADVAITARHYARWCGGDEYRPPIPPSGRGGARRPARAAREGRPERADRRGGVIESLQSHYIDTI